MPARRFLKYLNLGIAAILIVILAGVYWFAYRPLPETSGTIRAPISSKATVARDSLGVPHITAATTEDALFVQGFVTAQDRLWQMDGLRRLAAGEVAEVAGKAALESDRDARRLRLRRLAEEHAGTLHPDDRAAMAAFARGVNFFLETHRGRLPLAFTLLRYDPRPWRVADSVLVGLQMHQTLTKTWTDDLEKQNLMTGGDAGKVGLLYPARAGGEVLPGSNAWVISGNRSATGRPVLANDPHLPFSLPSTWHMVHLQSPGLNASGVTLPGLPGVIIGHNDRIAWGITNLGYDVQDLYVEKFDPRSGRYAFRGGIERAQAEREVIAARGGERLEVVNWVTRHGPVFIMEAQRYLSLKWSAAEPGGFQYPLVEVSQADNWQQFREALSRFAGPPLNFVYADIDGNIGYQVAGKLPIRRNFDGDVPVAGASGEFEWEGFIPFDQLPSIYNPPSGMIVSANQNPFPVDYPYPVNGRFSPPYRDRRIHELLTSKPRHRPEEMLGIQTDVYSAFHQFVARQAVAANERKGASNPLAGEATALLREWNGEMRKGQAAPMIARLLEQHLRRAIAERASPGKGLLYDFPMSPAVIERLLRERPKDWFDDYDRLLVESLASALAEGRRMQGQDVSKWDYGRMSFLRLVHPVYGQLPLVGRYFNIGPAPLNGSPTTVLQIALPLGPSMRMVMDVGDWDRSMQNITIGQSGQILSSHYKDQWKAFYEGRSFPMQFGKVEAKDVLTLEPSGR